MQVCTRPSLCRVSGSGASQERAAGQDGFSTTCSVVLAYHPFLTNIAPSPCRVTLTHAPMPASAASEVEVPARSVLRDRGVPVLRADVSSESSLVLEVLFWSRSFVSCSSSSFKVEIDAIARAWGNKIF